MNNPLSYFWRHPRRSGFIAFNILVLFLFVAWGAYTSEVSREGLAGVPSVVLGYTGMVFLAVVWIAGWVAWATFVARRHTHTT